MGDVINLRQVRKSKARAERARVADANRAKFGRSKAERTAQSLEEERSKRLLDGVRRDKEDDK